METIEIQGGLKSGTTSPAPRIECFVPEDNHTGIGMVVFAGGGYAHLSEHEGVGYAERFVKDGIACFVVTYRLSTGGHRHPDMLEDALAAMETVRARASEFGVDEGRLGVIGSSAGGHLAAHLITAYDQYESDLVLRPDFCVLCYPVITAKGKSVEPGSIQSLLGEDPTDELLEAMSLEKQVTENTTPCFIWHTCEDRCVVVENSMMFASALRECNVPFELHLYEKGRHGLGLSAPFDWTTDCSRWIKETLTVSSE